MKYIEYENYLVYENGDVFSLYRNKFLKPDITIHGYKQVSLFINKEVKRIKVHRLVALLFLKKIKGKNVINHKDGNKQNNHYTNLEWCTTLDNNKHARETGLNNISTSNSKRWEDALFRESVSQNISMGLKKSGCMKDEKNPNFKYRIYKDEEKITRKELPELLGYAQSTIDAHIKKVADGSFSDIFSKNNITVEKVS